MKRYYYDDPLAAAWMAEKFGMKFIVPASENGFVEEVLDGEDIITYWESWGITKALVHPDSRKILDPIDGDIIIRNGKICITKEDPFHVTVIALSSRCIRHLENEQNQVIFRRGLSFHWPKIENLPA